MQVRIPSSASRKSPCTYAKLLRRVRNPACSGFDFEGEFFRPGVMVEERELRPSAEWPVGAVLLECAGISKAVRMNRPHGDARSEYLYILWQYDPARHDWFELGRAISMNWDWAMDLAPIAMRAIGGRPFDVGAVADRIEAAIWRELEALPEDVRGRVAGVAHDWLAAAIAGECRAKTKTSDSVLLTTRGRVPL
jgi:hypothetical protein